MQVWHHPHELRSACDDARARDAWDTGAGLGRQKIFEVRRIYNDVNFLDEFLTPEFVERHKMYQCRTDPATGETKIVSRDFDRIKQTLLYRISNMGQPFMYVVDGNYLNRGELFLAHQFSGLEVDASKATQVLKNLRLLWGRPVHLQARINDEMYIVTVQEVGGEAKKQKITDETPAPTHIVE